MEHKLAVRIAVPMTVTLLLGCASTHLEEIQKANVSYKWGKIASSERDLRPFMNRAEGANYPLALLSQGSIALARGDYRHARECLSAALTNLDVSLDKAGVATQVLRRETGRLYRSYPHERTLAHYYLGICFLQQAKLDEARVEFAQALECDKANKPEDQGDVAAVHFLSGLTSISRGESEDAQVSFRRVTELRPDFPFGWYALCRASELGRDRAESDDAWSRYESLTPQADRLLRDGSSPCVLFLIDEGWSPVRKGDKVASWSQVRPDIKELRLSVLSGHRFSTFPIDDIWYQTQTEAGGLQEVGKLVVGAVAKEAIKALPFGSLFAGKTEADVRAWEMSPGRIHVAVIPLSTDPTTVTLEASDKKGTPLPLYDQVMYYLTGRPFDAATPVYVRVMPNADYADLH